MTFIFIAVHYGILVILVLLIMSTMPANYGQSRTSSPLLQRIRMARHLTAIDQKQPTNKAQRRFIYCPLHNTIQSNSANCLFNGGTGVRTLLGKPQTQSYPATKKSQNSREEDSRTHRSKNHTTHEHHRGC